MNLAECIDKYGDSVDFSILISYKDYEKTFTVNDNDPDLIPVTITLPSCPDWGLIEGFGKRAEDQMFQFAETPSRITELSKNVSRMLADGRTAQKNKVLTSQDIIDEVWNQLSNKQVEYEDEIQWIKKQIWHCHYGYWFFNNGMPTYIDAWHYRFLNFWDLTDAKTEYRDRDRRWFHFIRYAYTCTEDEHGYDVGLRTCFGVVYPKHRRDGATHKSLCIGYDIMTKVIGSVIGGIQSFDDDNAGTHYKEKLIPAFKVMPFFFKPMWKGTQAPQSELSFTRVGNKVGDELGCKIDYATTCEKKFYDGKKLYYYQQEEIGKTIRTDVNHRWDTVKLCLAQGAEKLIHGFSIGPTTVDEIEEGGGKNFEAMCNNSKFYERIKGKNQTVSGLFRIFIPAYDGMEGFVDKYGLSVIGEPVGYQKESFSMGAMEYIDNTIAEYVRKGDPVSMEKMREFKRHFPTSYADCFNSVSGDTGFNIEELDKAIRRLKNEAIHINNPPTVTGNFKRVIKGEPPMDSKEFLDRQFDRIKNLDSRVEFFPDPFGKWKLSKILAPTESNRKVKMDSIWYPEHKYKFTHSADAFQFLKKGEAQMRDDKSKLSKGGIATFWERDKVLDPDSKDIKEWESYRFVCTYYNRLVTDDELAEDALMQTEYFGGEMYPERNIPLINKHFIKRGYGGYLKYEIDELTRKPKDEPGFYSLMGSKQELFKAIQRYTDRHARREKHIDFIQQVRDIKGIEYMTDYDLFVACGGCLLGSEVVRFEMNFVEEEEKEMERNDVDIIMPSFRY